jgi:mannose-1-phosphate guanylyltransferase/phosphomannomutase
MTSDHATVLVLCLGAASRMRPLSLGLPKALIPFCGRPLLEYTLEGLRRFGLTDVVLVGGPGDDGLEQIAAWGRGLNLRVARRGLGLGSAGVVKDVAAELAAPGDLLVIYGDSLLRFDFDALRRRHRSAKSLGGLVTVACHEPDDLVVPGAERTNYGVLAADAEGRVVRFQEKPPVGSLFSRSASAGVFLLDPEALGLIPARRPADLSADMIAPAAGTDGPVFAFDIAPGYRFDIGTMPAYLARQLDALAGRVPVDNLPDGFTPERRPPFSRCGVEGPVLIGSGTAIADSAMIADCAIGGDVTIGPDSRIRRSIVLDGVQIGRGVFLDGVIVGPAAWLGDGVRLARGSVVGGWSVLSATTDPPQGKNNTSFLQ